MAQPSNSDKKNRGPSGPRAASPGRGKRSSTKGSGSRTGIARPTRSAVLRRPPAKGLPRLRHDLRRGWRQLLEVSPLWVLLFLAVSASCLLPRQSFLVPFVEAGSIAARTYIADRDLVVADEAATLLLQQGAENSVLPVYDFDRTFELDRQNQLAELFREGRAALAPPAEAEDGRPAASDPAAPSAASEAEAEAAEGEDPVAGLLERLESVSSFRVTSPQVELLVAKKFSTEIEERLSGILSRVLHLGLVSDRELLLEHRARGITVQELPDGNRRTELDLYRYLDYPGQVRQVIERDLLSWDGLRSRERKVFAELILANCAPNLTYNSSATLKLRSEAAQAVGAVTHTIRKGEVIVRKGEKVELLAARAIDQMAGASDLRRVLLTGLGTLSLLTAAVLLLWLAGSQEGRRDRSRKRQLSEGLMLLMLHLAGASLGYFVAGAVSNALPNEPFNSLRSYTYALPFAALALVSVLLYGRNMALVLSFVFSLLVGHVAGGEAIWPTIFYSVAGSLGAIFALDQFQLKQRSALTRAGAVIGAVNAAALLTLQALEGEIGGLSQIGFDLLCGFTGGLLAAAVAAFAVPILEGLLGITTSIKLIELANPNLPLLRRLALEAPGTFQHSLAVANLAKSGVEAIDGDALLVNTCALYHDIGKMFRPRYFIENQSQVPGPNPHDKIQPSMSALILINHVKEGLEMAHHYHLPEPIFEGIETHHGTRLIKFFYNKARERCDPDTGEIREEEFRYPGPKPQSKEMGVLMLADAVEAASRTLLEATRQKIRGLLQAIFDDCLRDGQLDQTDLTLGDLRKVEDAFLRVLTNIYHRRIDYPGFDFNRDPRNRDAADQDATRPDAAQADATQRDAAERRQAS